MSELAEFDLRPECPACGYDRWEWHWFGSVKGLEWQIQLAILSCGALTQDEHIRLTCERCGHALAMRTRDAE